jgi:hypothetical protein
LLKSEEEWESALGMLLKEPALASRIGQAAREDIIRRYSYESLMPRWAEALRMAFPEKLGQPCREGTLRP